ncbi:MAG: transcriptional repressor [Anaerolineae bacterium]|nr:transcriptional repressor [Anaerolineae bacterium]
MSEHPVNTVLLHEMGFRVTAQRRTVLEVIAASPGHLTAEQVYERARKVNPHISLATVYRTLNVLTEAGLIKQRHISPDHARSHFETAEAQDHFHFRCLNCGRVVEFRNDAAVRLFVDGLRGVPGVGRILDICTCVEGYCEACAPQAATR